MPPMYEPSVHLIGFVFAAFIVASIPVLIGFTFGSLLHGIKLLISQLWS